MARDRKHLLREISTLRAILAELKAELEASEEYRALQQLDERERIGDPLETLDGVTFRGRLVRKLEESNRIWRAHARVEEAIAHLEGEDQLEPSLIPSAAEPPEPIGRPLARPNTPKSPAVPAGQSPATPARNRAAGEHAGIAALPLSSLPTRQPATEPASREQPSFTTAPTGSSALPHTIPPPPQNFTSRESRVEITPNPARPETKPLAVQSPAADSPQRTVLDRIRLVSTIATTPAAEPADAAKPRDTPWGAATAGALPPAIDPVAVPDAPGAKQQAPGAASDDSAVPAKRLTDAILAPPAVNAPAREQLAAGLSQTEQQEQARLDTLELELARLIEFDTKVAQFPGARIEPVDRSSTPYVASIEPDVRDDLGPDADVDEAEVTIIKFPEPHGAGLEATESTVVRPGPTPLRPPPRPLARPASLPAKKLEGENTATATDQLDVEEADVEIVVPPRQQTGAVQIGPIRPQNKPRD